MGRVPSALPTLHMTYTPPALSVLRASVSRDLRDPNNKTFTAAEVDDLINAGIVEVSRVYPKEQIEILTVDAADQAAFDCEAMSLFRVEVLDEDDKVAAAPYAVQDNRHSEGGWDFHGHKLYLPAYVALGLETTHKLRVWGYYERDYLNVDGDVFDGDADAEFATRNYALMLGYQRLQNDRILFQEWLTTTGNTDVSPNQLAQTADMYQGNWRDTRNRIRILQRQ